MTFDLLVVGEINPDLILRGDDLSPAFGQAEKLVDARGAYHRFVFGDGRLRRGASGPPHRFRRGGWG